MEPTDEIPAYALLLGMHLGLMSRRLRELSAEHWDWTPNVAAPTARALASHTLGWLICDRQHIVNSNVSTHPLVPEIPQNTELLCNQLDAEMAEWKTLFVSLTPEELNQPRRQFNEYAMNIRGFICHIIQNTIYKNGQLASIYFALGYDGAELYSAPYPNEIYLQISERIA